MQAQNNTKYGNILRKERVYLFAIADDDAGFVVVSVFLFLRFSRRQMWMGME